MLGYFPGEPMTASSREFVMVTLWRDVEALREFAGDSWATPIVAADEVPLVEEMFVHHYERFDRVSA